jgi:hypothetical protein
MKTRYSIELEGRAYFADTLVRAAQVVSAGTGWGVKVEDAMLPDFTVVSVSRRGAVPTILFRSAEGTEIRMKTTKPAATAATKLLERAFKKPFNAAQLAAQDEKTAELKRHYAARVVTQVIAERTAHPAGSISMTDAAFLTACGIVQALTTTN